MKKTLAIVLAVLLIVTSFVSCNKKAATTTTATAAPAEVKPVLGSEPVKLIFWHSGAENDGVAIDNLVKKFNETNQYQITVEPVFQGQYADSLAVMMSMSAAGNYEELPDIMQIATGGISGFYDCEKAFSVDDAIAYFGEDIKSNYLTGALGTWVYKGEQMALPFATSTTITYYNKDLLKKAGWDHCPDTFADIIKLAADMKKAGITATVYQDVPTTSTIAPWLGQLGSYVMNGKNGTEEDGIKLECIDNGAMKTFLTEWKAMSDAGALVSGSPQKNDFYAGNVALITGTNSGVTDFIDKIGGKFELGTSTFFRVNDKASYGATPQGSALCMFDHDSDVRKAAVWEFIKFLTNAESQAEFGAATGYTPAAVGATDLPIYQEYLATHPQQAIVSEQLAKTPADMRGCSPHSVINADFYFGIQNAVKDFLSKGLSVDEGVKLVNDTLQPLLDQVALLVD